MYSIKITSASTFEGTSVDPERVVVDPPVEKARSIQRKKADLLMQDYRKFKGFRPCYMNLAPPKPEEVKGACNRCPARFMPPCRDKESPYFNPHDKYAKRGMRTFKPCRAEDYWYGGYE